MMAKYLNREKNSIAGQSSKIPEMAAQIMSRLEGINPSQSLKDQVSLVRREISKVFLPAFHPAHSSVKSAKL
jgi:hypothetical protein